MRWKKITIVGVGLLGGSLGLAIKRHRLAARVVGYARRAGTIAECRRLKATDETTLDLAAAVTGADLVILCTPLRQMRPLVQALLPSLKRGAVVTDVGSVKASVVREVETRIAKAGGKFVGSHPMAGGEKTGVAASQVDLFEDAMCVVTPTRRTDPAALRKVVRFWRDVGARVLQVSPEAHDQLVARSSHLPHLVAATLATTVLDPKRPKEQGKLCATGFRDTTRVASGSPEMWRDIALTNNRELLHALRAFGRELKHAQAVLATNDPDRIFAYFERARARREAWCVAFHAASGKS